MSFSSSSFCIFFTTSGCLDREVIEEFSVGVSIFIHTLLSVKFYYLLFIFITVSFSFDRYIVYIPRIMAFGYAFGIFKLFCVNFTTFPRIKWIKNKLQDKNNTCTLSENIIRLSIVSMAGGLVNQTVTYFVYSQLLSSILYPKRVRVMVFNESIS
jgi:hypothetical protein